MTALTATLRRLYTASPALTVASLLMLPDLAWAIAGLWLDPRLITGMPAWLKPAKFAASSAIYGLTLAWAFTHLAGRPRLRRVVGGLTAAVLVGEVAIINLQAWRGTTSHFNVGTPLDAALFAIMGVGILVQTLASVAVAVALWREPFADRALGWALRAGLTITIAGALIGGMMTRPTEEQLTAMKSGERPVIVGAHTVGALDGASGLPLTGWSVNHGDLRVPHFVGLHAFQVLPFFAVGLGRGGWKNRQASRAVAVAAVSYAGLFALLLAEALMGQSVLAPGQTVAMAFGAWALLSVVAVAAALFTGTHRPAVVAIS